MSRTKFGSKLWHQFYGKNVLLSLWDQQKGHPFSPPQILAGVFQAAVPARPGRKWFMAQQDQPALDQNHLCRRVASFGAASELHLDTILGGLWRTRDTVSLPHAQLPSSGFIAMSLLSKHQYLYTSVCTASFLHLRILVKHWKPLLKKHSLLLSSQPCYHTLHFALYLGKKNQNKTNLSLHH